jgi:hypothetical protein
MRISRIRQLGGLALLLSLAALAASGCGKKNSTVTGKVTYKGVPLKGGIVSFLPPRGEGAAIAADIGQDGTYTAENVPTGEMRVTVDTAYLKPPADFRGGPPNYKPPEGAGGGYKPPDLSNTGERYTKIPDKYSDPDASGLTLTVKGGAQTFPIDLTD